MTEYSIIRSGRKTLGLQVKEDGRIIVRAPYRVSKKQIESFVLSHDEWIRSAQKKMAVQKEQKIEVSDIQRQNGIQRACQILPERTAYFAERMGVTYGRITIREQKTRWGSCSSKGNLNFNWKLVLLPEKLLDYVVVHELAHRREMNHSSRFWSVVEQELPDYRERRAKLKTFHL